MSHDKLKFCASGVFFSCMEENACVSMFLDACSLFWWGFKHHTRNLDLHFDEILHLHL